MKVKRTVIPHMFFLKNIHNTRTRCIFLQRKGKVSFFFFFFLVRQNIIGRRQDAPRARCYNLDQHQNVRRFFLSFLNMSWFRHFFFIFAPLFFRYISAEFKSRQGAAEEPQTLLFPALNSSTGESLCQIGKELKRVLLESQNSNIQNVNVNLSHLKAHDILGSVL